MRKGLIYVIPVLVAVFALALYSCKQADKMEKPAGEKPAEAAKPLAQAEGTPEIDVDFTKSLHYTGEGMRYWYEEHNGFMQITGIPYKDLGCKKCHADSCDKCHGEEKDGKLVFSKEKANDSKTCLKCHARAGAAAKFDKKAGVKDVHTELGFACSDCHKAADVHGDGKEYHSMRDPNAVKVSCSSSDCHSDLNKHIEAHKAHSKNNIDCTACHVSSTITCVNCHFDDFLARGGKRVPGTNFFPNKSWTLLVNHDGKVTTGNAQTLVGKGKKFVSYVPYFTHSIVKEGRKCQDCHGNEAAAKMLDGGKVEMGSFKDGKLSHAKGVIPFVPEKLVWPWLDKDGDKWIELKSDEEPIIQNAAYAEPLTEKQLKMLKMKKTSK